MVKLAFWKDWSGCFCGEDGLQEAIIDEGRYVRTLCSDPGETAVLWYAGLGWKRWMERERAVF